MKATVLIDNIAESPLKDEWGLCVFIEHNGKKILLDTGASALFKANAKKLGVDLSEVDFAVLSHAHYDHADGMKDFFSLNSKAKFYLKEECSENCYGRKLIFSKYIGIKKGTLSKFQSRIEYVKGDAEISEGVWLIPHKTANLHEAGKKAGMYKRVNKKWVPDNFDHEQSLVIDTEKGLVIFNSCCHGGADNIIKEVASTFPEKKIYALIGGFHLFESPDSDVVSLAKRIEDTGIELIYTGHCTGKKAYKILKDNLKEKCNQLSVGLVIEV